MLSSISWSTYWICIGCLLPLYYLYIGIAYFREEVSGMLKGGLPAKKKKNLSSIPSSNKNSILSAASIEEEEENDSQSEPQSGWEPMPAGNEKYAAAKGEQIPVANPPVVQTSPPVVQTSAPEEKEHMPFSDIALEVQSGQQLISTIALEAGSAPRMLDIDMFIAFLDQHNTSGQTVNPAYTGAGQVHTGAGQVHTGAGQVHTGAGQVHQQEKEQEEMDYIEQQQSLAMERQTLGDEYADKRLEIDMDTIDQSSDNQLHPYKNHMF